jgi:hypothetical protein
MVRTIAPTAPRGRRAGAALASAALDRVPMTGTLTRGAHVVTGVAAAPGLGEAEVVRLAGSVESDGEQPLARAIVAAARERGSLAPRDFRSLTSRGSRPPSRSGLDQRFPGGRRTVTVWLRPAGNGPAGNGKGAQARRGQPTVRSNVLSLVRGGMPCAERSDPSCRW